MNAFQGNGVLKYGHTILVMMPSVTVTVFKSTVVNDPDAPMFLTEIVPKPVMSVLGIVADAVKAAVALPLTYPVNVIAPDPPLGTPRVPASVTAPVVAVVGVSPVVPPEKDSTPVLLMVTLPVALDTKMPVPAKIDSTPELATVIAPAALVTVMPTPVPNVLRVYPVLLPISNWPLVGIVPSPVPPLMTGVMPVPPPVTVYWL